MYSHGSYASPICLVLVRLGDDPLIQVSKPSPACWSLGLGFGVTWRVNLVDFGVWMVAHVPSAADLGPGWTVIWDKCCSDFWDKGAWASPAQVVTGDPHSLSPASHHPPC